MPQEQADPAPEASALVGRDDELRRLVRAVGRAPGVVVVEGEAGIGKTRLVGEMAGHGELAGVRVLVGGCRQIREPFPLGPVLDAVRRVGDVAAGRRLSAVTGALRPLLPELAERLPEAPAPLHDHAAERHRVFRGLVSLLAEVGRAVLVIEDAHWADEQTVDFLGYLLDDPPPALTVVLTYRGEETGAALRQVTARPRIGVGHTHLALRPLDAAQTRLLASAILRTDAHVSEEFAVHLCERASGIPFAIQELLALLRERGSLVLRGGSWSRRAIDDLDIPVGVRNSVLGRVLRLSAAGQAVVGAAAVLVEPVPVEVLAATSQVPAADTLEGLTEGLAAGLLQEQDGTVGFRHALAAQAVYESILLPRRQDLHRRAAAAVRSRTPVPLGQVAHHLRQARRYDAWVDAAEAAAEQAAALADDTEAARLLEDVLRTAPLAPARRGELTVKLGRTAIEARRYADVLDLFEQALAAEQPRAVRGQLRFFTVLLHEQAGSEASVMRGAAAAALEDLDEHPVLAAWAMIMLGLPYGAEATAAEHVAWTDRALALVPRIGERAWAAFALGKITMIRVMQGDPRWAALTDRVLELTGGIPEHPREVNAYVSIADGACQAGQFGTVQRLLGAAAESRGGHRLRLLDDLVRLVLDYDLGHWAGLDERAADLHTRLRDRPKGGLTAECVAAGLALARGELDGIGARLAAAREEALESAAVDVLLLPVAASLRLAAAGQDAEGGVDAAVDAARAALRIWELKAFWPVAVRVLPPLAEALLAAGRTAEARELPARYSTAADGLDLPFAPAAFAHTRGFLAAADGDHGAAARHFAAAAEAYARIPCPYERAQASEQAAVSLARAGEPAAAAEALRTAVDGYRELGAAWDLDRAGRRAPARHRGGRRGYGLHLSPREMQVAELVTSGLTSKEVSETLFVSVRTVESHVSTILRKLNLRSRVELANHLRSHRGQNP
ncbi:LuxR family transcriptional regulator [Streptomyces aculeolatus]|uniref:helix-turn-helix transcriptional regulator n=1 Tax=Streptomyces aculeolatus TaxID=270689 RepID=UPI001CEC5AC0|nr:LuxR family transcriptional regulator [Streptomyces aculeolatus]